MLHGNKERLVRFVYLINYRKYFSKLGSRLFYVRLIIGQSEWISHVMFSNLSLALDSSILRDN